MNITQETVKQLFDHDANNGDLIWRRRVGVHESWNTKYAGKIAGSVAVFEYGGPYISICIDCKPYLAHRLIWLYVYGYMPDKIDHKDGCGINNRLDNLREATQSQNQANRNEGNRGVEQRGNSYRARIKVQGQIIQLGSYRSREDAQLAYNAAADKYFGEFATCNR